MSKSSPSHSDRLKKALDNGVRLRELLPSGVTVLSEVIPTRAAVNFGVWVANGSQGDAAAESGLSHFLEHLVFKGSHRFKQKEIATFFDKIGGSIDAYTTREYIGFTSVCVGSDLPEAADRLFDMVLDPIFPAADLEKERLVIVEECKMSDDSPESRIYDLLYENAWPKTGLGRPIQGYLDTVKKIDRATVVRGYHAKFVPGQLIVAAAGNFDPDMWHKLVSKYFGKLKARPAPPAENLQPVKPFVAVNEKSDLTQSHLLVSFPGFKLSDPRRWAAIVMDNAVGGTLSSRLFQNLREKRGLCYSTYSNASFHAKTGLFSFYAATSRDRTSEALKLLAVEVRKLRQAGITAAETALSKKNLIGRTLLSMDSLSGRLTRMIMNEIAYRRQVPLGEVIDAIEQVDAGKIKKVAAELLVPASAALTAVVPTGALGAKEKALFVREYRG
jgi:predicted Zn-dependent peptidase